MIFTISGRMFDHHVLDMVELGVDNFTSMFDIEVFCYMFLLYPQHTKYVEGYIVFVFPSVRPFFCDSVRPSVNILHQSFA